MTNAKLLILFFDVYRMHCDAESNGDDDASTFITESYEDVRNYALDCANNEKEMTARDIVQTVTSSIFKSMSMDDGEHTSDCMHACAAFIADLMKTFNDHYYV